MSGLFYQFKSVWKDKFCMMCFLLPIIVASALNLVGGIDLSSVAQFHFGVLEGELPDGTISWLERYGTVTAYQTQEELTDAVKEPSTSVIGVEWDGNGIRTMVSGDELDLFRQTADTLPALYRGREHAGQIKVTVLERSDMMDGLQRIFIAMTLLVAMFMGCTFNAMNIISEKENGVAFVNQVLPMTRRGYVIQKVSVGYICGSLSAILTALLCFQLSLKNVFLMLALIMLSSFVSAMIGLLIGTFSENLMAGVVSIKIMMIVFIAVPLLSYLLGASGFVSAACYFVPSNATFEGVMNLTNGSAAVGKDLFILMGHCVFWGVLYRFIMKYAKS